MNIHLVLIFTTLFFSLQSCKAKDKITPQFNTNREVKITVSTDSVEREETVLHSGSNLDDTELISNEPTPDEMNTQTQVGDESQVTNLLPVDHSMFDELLTEYVSTSGEVNYRGMLKEKEKLQTYLDYLAQHPPADTWSTHEIMAYYINLYNAATLQLILANYPLRSIKDIGSPWDKKFIKVGDKTYSLNDIEHKKLRKMNDPRIHFAIVCASVSCPKLQNKAFTAFELDDQLNLATKEFLNDSSKNQLSQNKIKISKIFKWFTNDFTKNGSVIDFINQYTKVTISKKAKISYTDYNWDLNGI